MAKYKNKIEAIIFSDLHINKYAKFNQGNRRTLNALDVLRNIKLLTKRHKTVSLFLGDLFHKEKNITNELLGDTLPFLSKMWGNGNFKTYAITGNHDQSSFNTVENQSPSYINTLSKTFPGLVCMDFKIERFDTWDLYGVPYLTHDIGLIDTVKNFELDVKKVNVLMLHTTMPNARDTDNRTVKSNLAQVQFERTMGRFDIILCGHIHKPEMYDIGKTRVIQVGAPQQQRATDRNCDMGYWIMYNNFEFEFVPFKHYPKFIELPAGTKPPDNKNFYTFAEVKKAKTKQVNLQKFSTKLSGRKLAKNYLKVKAIEDKDKKIALTETLKKVL